MIFENYLVLNIIQCNLGNLKFTGGKKNLLEISTYQKIYFYLSKK